MADIKAKLVNLICGISDLWPICDAPTGDCHGCHEFADRLIAKGATIQEWISVEERLPQTTDAVLCWYEYFRYGEHQQMFQTFGIGFCIHGNWCGEVANGHKAKVLYWMSLPEPPKGE